MLPWFDNQFVVVSEQWLQYDPLIRMVAMWQTNLEPSIPRREGGVRGVSDIADSKQ